MVGSPNISALDWFQIEFSAKGSFPSTRILLDDIRLSSGGFTMKNVERGDIKYEDARIQYKKPDVFMEELSKIEGAFWFVDYERDIHFFKSTSRENTNFSISPTSNNYGDLKRSVDVSQLKNRQTIR